MNARTLFAILVFAISTSSQADLIAFRNSANERVVIQVTPTNASDGQMEPQILDAKKVQVVDAGDDASFFTMKVFAYSSDWQTTKPFIEKKVHLPKGNFVIEVNRDNSDGKKRTVLRIARSDERNLSELAAMSGNRTLAEAQQD